MEEQKISPGESSHNPIIANLMGHEIRALGGATIFRIAMIAFIVALPWSLLFNAPMAPEAVASCTLAMLFHEAGVTMRRISGWVILLGVLLASRPFFAWVLSVVTAGA